MKIVADQNIPLVHALFDGLGEVVTLPGRTLCSSDLHDTDILLVRSITQVNEHLLKGTPVRFVGSCTIGIDHIDTTYLDKQGIHWANAPGCNANAVVQYVMSAMAAIRPQWQQQTIGIVGCGNIGGRLYRRLTALGVDCRVYDPFLNDSTISTVDTLDAILVSDIITLHTPLTTTGEYPSYHLFNRESIKKIPDHSLLINSGRGAVIDNQALLNELQHRPLSVVLDVWENEPDINRELLSLVALGTPHIAGYSVEGKEMGSYQVYESLCEFLSIPIAQQSRAHLSTDKQTISLDSLTTEKTETKTASALIQHPQQLLNQLLLRCYDIHADDNSLRKQKDFDGLRKQYLSRREYTHFDLQYLPEQQNIAEQFDILTGKK